MLLEFIIGELARIAKLASERGNSGTQVLDRIQILRLLLAQERYVTAALQTCNKELR